MGDFFLGEIRAFPYGTIPKGWLACSGQTLLINQYQALYSLIGTTFGGDARTNFQLPNLSGRVALGLNSSGQPLQGTAAGEETHVLALTEIPAHTHNVMADAVPLVATSASPLDEIWAPGTLDCFDSAPVAGQTMATAAIAIAGANVGHDNMQPYLTFNYCIAVVGLYPSRP